MESNLSFGKFWWWVILLSFDGSFGIVRAIMFIITIVLAIISSQHPEWKSWVNTLAWASTLGIFLVLFIPSIMRQSHFLYKQKADKVQEYETQAIELEPDCRLEKLKGVGDVWVARVGVRACGLRVIRGVLVYLTDIDGNQNDLFDTPLHPSRQFRNATGATNVNPGKTTRFVEVLHWNSSVSEMGIPYHLTSQLREASIDIHNSRDSLVDAVDVRSHTLKLYATGEDIKPVETEFKVEILNNRLVMHRTGDE